MEAKDIFHWDKYAASTFSFSLSAFMQIRMPRPTTLVSEQSPNVKL